MKPLAIDLFCGLGGWTEGLLAEGYEVVGFDIERHQYGDHRYPAQLVIQDVLTLQGSQLRDAALIVASPPCQEYSYMAMPWKLAKAKAAAIRADTSGKMLADLNRLFEACFRIAGQASLAAGRRIPLVVENVKGAQPWVGRARWNYGSFYLWGDVPALMPVVGTRKLAPHLHLGGGNNFLTHGREAARHDPRHAERRAAEVIKNNGSFYLWGDVPALMPSERQFKSSGMNWSDRSKRGQDFTRCAVNGYKGVPHRTAGHWTNSAEHEGMAPERSCLTPAQPQYRPSRKAASAMIAKIPLPLSRHIAAVYHPKHES